MPSCLVGGDSVQSCEAARSVEDKDAAISGADKRETKRRGGGRGEGATAELLGGAILVGR